MEWRIKKTEDGNSHELYIANSLIAEVSQGWQRLGGQQWIVYSPCLNMHYVGCKTIKEAKRMIDNRIVTGLHR